MVKYVHLKVVHAKKQMEHRFAMNDAKYAHLKEAYAKDYCFQLVDVFTNRTDD